MWSHGKQSVRGSEFRTYGYEWTRKNGGLASRERKKMTLSVMVCDCSARGAKSISVSLSSSGNLDCAVLWLQKGEEIAGNIFIRHG